MTPCQPPEPRRGEINSAATISPDSTASSPAAADRGAITGRLSTVAGGRRLAYVWATFATAVAGLVAAAVEKVLPLPNLSLVFLSAVLLVGVRFGTAGALYTAGLGFAVYNFFFTDPHFTFAVHQRGDVLTLLFFVLVAVLTGNLAGQVRSQLEAVRENAKRTDILYRFARALADAMGADEVLDTISRHIAVTFAARSLVFLAATDRPGEMAAASAHPPEGGVSYDDRAAAEQAWRSGAAGSSVPLAGLSATYIFAPMKTGNGTIGLVGLAVPLDRGTLPREQLRLFEAVADQSAVAIERARLAADIEKARILSETENLRTALLSSISHDLRTPLSSIIGSATTLASVWESLSAADRRDLTDTILEESERLNRLVQNLLDMTRIEHGGLRPRRDWVDLREIVGRAVYRMRGPLGRFRTVVTIGDNIPLLHVDPVLLEQVFVNVLENAAKHAPASSTIKATATYDHGYVEICIEDQGPGIAPDDRALVFEMFSRSKNADGRTGGTGLGLAICKGFIEAHGGTIAARSPARGSGTAIIVSLPVGQITLAEAG